MLQYKQGDDLIKCAVTDDKMWTYYYTPKTKCQSMTRVQPGEQAPKKQKLSFLHTESWPLSFETGKEFFLSGIFLKAQRLTQVPTVMFSNSFNTKFLENIQVVTKLLPMRSSFMTTRPHSANKTQTLLQTFGWMVCNHLPYSLYLAPSDYCLFPVLQNNFGRWRFENDEDLKLKTNRFFQKSSGQLLLQRLMLLPISLQVLILKWLLEVCAAKKSHHHRQFFSVFGRCSCRVNLPVPPPLIFMSAAFSNFKNYFCKCWEVCKFGKLG